MYIESQSLIHKLNEKDLLYGQFPNAPNDVGVFTEVMTKTTYTENTVTRITNNTNLQIPLTEEVCMIIIISFN